MSVLPTDLRNKLERACIAARNLAERAAADALKSLAVAHHEPYGHMTVEQRGLRNKLRARARQLGDSQDAKGQLGIAHLAQECAYEHWHRMLFARFLAENNLLIEPEMGVAVSLDEVKELAKDAKTNLWALAGRYAQTMLPEIFRVDDPVLQVPLAREDQIKLEQLLDVLAKDTFTAGDSLGWCYQFWQAERKDQVNAAGNKIGADELPSVTQLFTEDYMVDFLLDNTLGAWWAGKVLAASPRLAENAKSEEELRKAVELPGCPWKYLRFVKVGGDTSPRPSVQAGPATKSGEGESFAASRKSERASNSPSAGSVSPSPPSEGGEGRGEVGLVKTNTSQSLLTSAATKERWQPAASTFDGWPRTAKELKCLDPCCGSGHFVVAMFERLVALRMAEEKLDETSAVMAVIRDNLFGLEIDPRCTQIGAFNLALAAWRRVGHCALPAMHIACSGLAPNTREAEWLKLAGDSDKLQRGMARLYRLFKDAPVLGSLINPLAGGGDLLEAGFQELRPLLAKVLEAERFRLREGADDVAHEMAVTAQGITKAAEILASQFTLVATNVPYLGRGKQDDMLKDFCERVHPEAKTDLATCFVERCLTLCTHSGSTALVTPQNWLYQDGYKHVRKTLLAAGSWNTVAQLGEHGFDSAQAAGAFVAMVSLTRATPNPETSFAGFDALEPTTPDGKATALLNIMPLVLTQRHQLSNPDSRVMLVKYGKREFLSSRASSFQGIKTGDDERVARNFWELARIDSTWKFYQGSVLTTRTVGGMESVVWWADDGDGLARKQGMGGWGKRGVMVSQMRSLPVALYFGDTFDSNASPIVVEDKAVLPALWAFCSSEDYFVEVRKVDQSLKPTNKSLVQVPFDLAHWQTVAAEKYPHGLPKPFSSDPTQWLFNGHPKGAGKAATPHPGPLLDRGGEGDKFALQVAVARLLGYQWPRQTGSSFPDCPALGPDGLEKLSDDDGISVSRPREVKRRRRSGCANCSRRRSALIGKRRRKWN